MIIRLSFVEKVELNRWLVKCHGESATLILAYFVIID